MLKKVILNLILLVAGFITFVGIQFELDKRAIYNPPDFEITSEVDSADIRLGERIYQYRAGCGDCHGKSLEGKKIIENGAIGTIYGPNLSPANLKSWTDKQIAKAIRYGVQKNGRSLQFMPSFDFQKMSKGDIAAIIKFIRSMPEVKTQNHENYFGPVAKMLSAFNNIPVMYPAKIIDMKKGFEEKPPEKKSFEFGKYLSNTCMGCHGDDFKGGPIPGGDPNWPPASNIRLGANSNYNLATFKNMFKTGVAPSTKKEMKPPMPIWLLKEFNEIEIESLWLYFSSLK